MEKGEQLVMGDEFSLAITGDETPDESILLSRIKEALNRGSKRINIINGYVVDTNSMVNVSIGPVLGEVTTDKAILMLEVTGEQDVFPVCAKLYKEQNKDEPLQAIDKEMQDRRPAMFEFFGLEPETEYTGKFYSPDHIKRK